LNMAVAMSARGCTDQALELLRRAADWDAENNVELGTAIWRLAEILRDFGRYDEAAATYRRILGRRQAGPDDRRKAHEGIALTEVPRRSQAARAAALAGCGLGTDNAPTQADAKAKLRSQALDWFKTELGALGKTNAPGASEDKTLLLRTLAYWKSTSDLAGVRAAEALDRLPVEERRGWSAFWSEVDTLLKPHDPWVHVRAGEALNRKGLYDAAAAEFREAVRLAPDDGVNCYKMAMAMRSQGHVDPAIDLLRRALKWDLEHNDHMGLAFWELGRTLRTENRFDDAIATFRRVREQKGFSSDDIHLADEEITATERERSVMGRLLELVKRQQPVDSAEAFELARLAAARSLHAAAARFWTSVMASNLPISAPHQAQFQVEALRSAVLAGCGQGKDAPPDDAAKAKLRSQAREWLQASLDLYSKAVDRKSVSNVRSAADFVYRLKLQPEFARVRDAEALAKLPEQEKLAWSALWSEVDSLSKKAGGR
jgi:tetratricopeptide (TPR) repeat protein